MGDRAPRSQDRECDRKIKLKARHWELRQVIKPGEGLQNDDALQRVRPQRALELAQTVAPSSKRTSEFIVQLTSIGSDLIWDSSIFYRRLEAKLVGKAF